MRYLIALALALLAAAASAATPPRLPVDVRPVGGGLIAVTALIPPGAVELCAGSGASVGCLAGPAGASRTVTIRARPEAEVVAWAGAHPYAVGGVASIVARAVFTAPTAVYLPEVHP